MKLRVGIYGKNGHQIHHKLANHPRAAVVAIAGIERADLPDAIRNDKEIRQYDSLDAMLRDERVELVSLCSPRRADQPRDAMAALETGKHVYAEKPAAMSEDQLDQILAAAQRAGKEFHEMAGTAFDQPYRAMRKIVQTGTIGTVVHVLAQKSYPYQDSRPQDENIDGGLIRQAGVHGARYVEHVAGVRIDSVAAIETSLGNPKQGGLRMAASMILKLANGGVGAVIANYFNPRGIGTWGNETLRIWGTRGMLETTDAGKRTRLVADDTEHGPIDVSEPSVDYFDLLVDHLRDGVPTPFTIEQELHPTRIVIRAKESADRSTL